VPVLCKSSRRAQTQRLSTLAAAAAASAAAAAAAATAAMGSHAATAVAAAAAAAAEAQPTSSRLSSAGSSAVRRSMSGGSVSSASAHSSMIFDAPPADTPGWHARQQLKLADFGVSKAVEADMVAGSTVGTVCGTPKYMAPEVGRMRQHSRYQFDRTKLKTCDSLQPPRNRVANARCCHACSWSSAAYQSAGVVRVSGLH